ncbi:MAG: HypC/HybG/HupF family hydrogenase formation chaperone [Chloroflexia bacterium]
MNDKPEIQLVGPSCVVDHEGHCITCSDEALPARVLAVDNASALATVMVEDETMEVDISLVDEVMPGDTLLVHGGVALGQMDIEGANIA